MTVSRDGFGLRGFPVALLGLNDRTSPCRKLYGPIDQLEKRPVPEGRPGGRLRGRQSLFSCSYFTPYGRGESKNRQPAKPVVKPSGHDFRVL
jgi:hypothetical protein